MIYMYMYIQCITLLLAASFSVTGVDIIDVKDNATAPIE